MKRNLLNIICLSIIVMSFTSCYSSIEQTLYSGNYEQAFEAALKKVKNDRKRDDYIALAERAYNKVLADERYQIERLKSNADPSDWGQIYNIYRNMEYRQRVAEPYLPLQYKDGRTANFPTHNYIRVIEEARENAAAYHYNIAVDLLNQPYKASAREAFYELDEINRYFFNYKDKNQLKAIAREKGTNQVLLAFMDNEYINLPLEYYDILGQANYEQYMDEWTVLHRDYRDSFQYDKIIEITVNRIDISPEQLTQNVFFEQKEVEDGVRPLLDENGNFVMDSSGNIIQIIVYQNLTCQVTEWQQTKTASIYTSFKIKDTRFQHQVVNQQFEDNIQFNNFYAQANGHIEILPPEIQAKLQQRPVPFPTNFDMVLQTTENIKIQIANAINQYDELLASL